MHSHLGDYQGLQRKVEEVLILVVMEDALALKARIERTATVLILVVMEDALALPSKGMEKLELSKS